MIIKDEGYILNAVKYGEKALIVTIFSRAKGRISGFCSDAYSKRYRGVFEVGNKIFFEASFRLEENMKRLFRVELIEPNAVNMMIDFKKLELMTAVVPMMNKVLNEMRKFILYMRWLESFFKQKALRKCLCGMRILSFICWNI